jgi:hypothetical protein
MRLARAASLGVTLTLLPSIALAQIDQLAVLQKIRPCWIPPSGPVGSEKIPVGILGTLGRDGRVVEARVAPESIMRDPVHAAVNNAALRAVLDPRCQPWPVPAAPYESWQSFRLTFDPARF